MTSDGDHPVVAIGCSWGGLQALSVVLEGLPRDLAAAVVIVQHRAHAPSSLASLLADHTPWPVCEAEDKEPISPGHVYLAPPGYHLLADGGRFALSTEAPVSHSRPSVDVLFESLAQSFGRRVIGVILTGANADGAAGLAEIIRHGGGAVVQSPTSAEKRAMPDAAIASAAGAEVASITEVASVVARLVARVAPENSGTA